MTDPEVQYRVLKHLESDPHMTQRQLAQILGVSLGKTNYVLKALIDVGWVKLGNFRRSDRKTGYAYLLTPVGVTEKAAITKKFLQRKREEYELLAAEIKWLEVEVEERNSS
jgi:EPS-associated MarR family transcriptional regulator